MYLINANDPKSIADISTDKRFFKKNEFNSSTFQKAFNKSTNKIFDLKNDQSFKKKIVKTKFLKNLLDQTKKTNSQNDSISITNENVWNDLNNTHVKRKKTSKQSKTIESYHDLLNDEKFNADEKIQQMKNIENDQYRKKFKLSMSQIAKAIDDDCSLNRRYFNKNFFHFDKNLMNYEMKKKRKSNYENFYFSSFYEIFHFNIFDFFQTIQRFFSHQIFDTNARFFLKSKRFKNEFVNKIIHLRKIVRQTNAIFDALTENENAQTIIMKWNKIIADHEIWKKKKKNFWKKKTVEKRFWKKNFFTQKRDSFSKNHIIHSFVVK